LEWVGASGTLATVSGRTLGRIVSINVGQPRTVEWFGRQVTSAIWKSPVEGSVDVRGVNLIGDDQADRRVHGGNDKAVYAYAAEDYRWWAMSLPDSHAGGTELGPGTFGDNLTTEGLDLGQAVIGERWLVGSAVLEVCQPRFPCAKLGMRMGDAAFIDLFDQARRPGAYLRIVEEGKVQPGDTVTSVHLPTHSLRVLDLVQAQGDRDVPTELLERIVAIDVVPEVHRAAAARNLARR
jgi:MOSC domain-containing protein YiiM